MLVAPQIDGKEIATVESLATRRVLSPVQSAMVDAGIVQCGYCTPSMELAIETLLKREENPTRGHVKDALSGTSAAVPVMNSCLRPWNLRKNA